ncbi:hypothetical protein [Hymenobacter algoricola]|uniref:Lipoprotein n=1 Tax=Hymenobacter algoricola TaxID=486267 RepID=A0ABP7MIS4_9BACT
MKSKFFLYAALLLLTQCSKCKQDDPTPKDPAPTLPAETRTGARTLGFRLNGEVWLPAGGTFGSGNLSAELNQGTLLINTRRSVFEVSQYINLRLTDVYNNTHFVLDSPTTVATGNYIRFADHNSSCEYESNSGPAGTVDITRLDPVARIVSGRFAFSLRKPGCPNIEATDGRFDIKY